jgi:hypothetical protein
VSSLVDHSPSLRESWQWLRAMGHVIGGELMAAEWWGLVQPCERNEAPRCKRGLRGVLCLHLRGQANQTTKAKSWRTPNGG